MTDGRTLPVPEYAGDTGEADPVLLSALDAFDRGELVPDAVARLLAGVRLLVPVVAVPVDVSPAAVEPAAVEPGETSGLASDKHVEMAMVTVTGRDGRRGLPVFTSVAEMRAWNREARPVPASASRAAQAAIEDGAEALLVDPTPRPRFVVQGDQLAALAAGPTTPPATAV